jgi:AcrR family transcriptional regulator
MFGTKKALFLEVMVAAFDRMTEGMREAAGTETGRDALARMGAQYNEMLADRTSLLLQLQGVAACGDREVRDAVRDSFGRMWQTVAKTTGLDPVTIKAFLVFGMMLNNGAALQVAELDEPWAKACGPVSVLACSTTSRPRRTGEHPVKQARAAAVSPVLHGVGAVIN